LTIEIGDPCPACLGNGTRVSDSRPYLHNRAWRRRRRYCRTCGHRWSTIEVPIELVEDGLIGMTQGAGIRTLVREVELAQLALDRFQRLAQARIGDAEAQAELNRTEPEAELHGTIAMDDREE
jgi:hypothetical protein